MHFVKKGNNFVSGPQLLFVVDGIFLFSLSSAVSLGEGMVLRSQIALTIVSLKNLKECCTCMCLLPTLMLVSEVKSSCSIYSLQLCPTAIPSKQNWMIE